MEYYSDTHITLYNSDCRDMGELSDGSVQCVVTSPPFWGLRKYSGNQELIWGGDRDCQHDFSIETLPRRNRGTLDIVDPNSKQATNFSSAYDATPMKACSLCSAWKGAYGLESTPEMYIEHTIEILREIRRVLRKDGVVFWDIGDSYASNGIYIGKYKETHPEHIDFHTKHSGRYPQKQKGYRGGSIKAKDLCLIPFKVAIAAQEDGWWVRSVIIWSKSNPMPESVTDRPTESHEYILMLTKNKNYYWDADAVRSPLAYGAYSSRASAFNNPNVRKDNSGTQTAGITTTQQDAFYAKVRSGEITGRNIRTVWEFPTQPYPEAHFAVFPEKLPEICIKAATPEVGCCSKCGAPWERVIKVNRPDDYDPSVVDDRYAVEARKASGTDGTNRPLSKMFKDSLGSSRETTGWQPTCKCNADKVPSLVLDPFAGSGTTLAVAKREGRRAVGYELSGEYCKLAKNRVMSITPPMIGL